MSELESPSHASLNRRAMLLGAVFLVGGSAALVRFTRDPQDTAAAGVAFSPDEFALLEQVTEVMIPATDTPGARGAGVPEPPASSPRPRRVASLTRDRT